MRVQTLRFVNVWLQSNLKKKKKSNFQPLEVVDRGSETQPQVVENLKTNNIAR